MGPPGVGKPGTPGKQGEPGPRGLPGHVVTTDGAVINGPAGDPVSGVGLSLQ